MKDNKPHPALVFVWRLIWVVMIGAVILYIGGAYWHLLTVGVGK